MSDYLIFCKIPVYEREWAEFHFGNPCRFPAKSNVNMVIRHFLRKRTLGDDQMQRCDGDIAVVIPDSKSKRPSEFNYMYEPGRRAVAEAIDDVFTMHLWESLNTEGARFVKLSSLLYDWMDANHISDDQYNNLRQKFLRIKDSYRLEAGINISRGYKDEMLEKTFPFPKIL